jgi:predicted transcriptional regulator
MKFKFIIICAAVYSSASFAIEIDTHAKVLHVGILNNGDLETLQFQS